MGGHGARRGQHTVLSKWPDPTEGTLPLGCATVDMGGLVPRATQHWQEVLLFRKAGT